MDTDLVPLIVLTLLLSAFFSGIEIAFISANRLRVELRKHRGTRRGKILAGFFEKPSQFLGMTLVGNNIALVLFGNLMTLFLDPILQKNLPAALKSEYPILFIVTIVTTMIVLIFGEFLPKTLGRLRPTGLLYTLSYPLLAIRYLLSVIVLVTVKLSEWLLSVLLKVNIENSDYAFTRSDLELFIRDITPDNEDEIDQELFENALYLKEVKVDDCMVPRTEMHAVDVNISMEDLLQVFIDSRHSKLIVYEDTIDNTIGYVHHQHMFKKPKDIRSILMELPLVPEVMAARELMNQFIKDRVSLAIVVDEFGGTAGIVTLEDILEEIFGEIEDEHDDEDYVEFKINDSEYIFAGRLEVDYINEKYDLNIPEGEYQTLSGYIVTATETIPEEGQDFALDGYLFILTKVSETRIETVKVRVLEEEKS